MELARVKATGIFCKNETWIFVKGKLVGITTNRVKTFKTQI